jgi:hypothetical protein
VTSQRAAYLRRAIPRLKAKRRRPLILITFPNGQTIGPLPVHPFADHSVLLDNTASRFTRTATAVPPILTGRCDPCPQPHPQEDRT